jgi:hypothetical protein
MESYALVFPILPGKLDEARAFAEELKQRSDEMEASRKRLRVTRESVWVNQTPMGDIGVVLLEADDVAGANRGFAESQEPFDVWFKERAQSFSGIDWSHPVPMSEVAYDFRF